MNKDDMVGMGPLDMIGVALCRVFTRGKHKWEDNGHGQSHCFWCGQRRGPDGREWLPWQEDEHGQPSRYVSCLLVLVLSVACSGCGSFLVVN